MNQPLWNRRERCWRTAGCRRSHRAFDSLALFVLALSCTANSIAQEPTELFFTEYQFNNPKIKAIGFDGLGLRELFVIPPNEWLPIGLTVDPADGKVYWADSSSPNNILRANGDGSSLESIIPVGASARGASLDGAGKVYYTAGNTIRRADLDGSNDELLFTALQTFPLSMPTVDATNGHVYFAADGLIRRIDLDGSNVKTIVGGVNTPTVIQLDIANSQIYWIDSNTNTDFVGRARLDDTEYTVLIDNSPSVVQSSGLLGLAVNTASNTVFFCDEILNTLSRANLDGSGVTVIYVSPPDLSPSGLTFDTGAIAQPIADCNSNSVADEIDIANSTSQDCNNNGFPDECEANPCPSRTFLVDNGSDPSSGRSIGGPTPVPNNKWEVFQPFDVPKTGWQIQEIGLDGWTSNYSDGTGFTLTVFPDDGTGNFANEASPIADVVFNFRFNPSNSNWVYQPLDISLPTGRHWVRLTANDIAVYTAAVFLGTSGLNSVSRSGAGNLFDAPPIALRIIEEPPPCLGDIAPPGGNGFVNVDDLLVLIGQWGAKGGIGDLDFSGAVNVDDLLILIGAWGPCP